MRERSRARNEAGVLGVVGAIERAFAAAGYAKEAVGAAARALR